LIFYIQGAPYLLTKSKSIKFQSVQSFNRISKRNRSTGRTTYKRDTTAIIAGLHKVLQAYATRGFKITAINGDNEFAKIVDKLNPSTANTLLDCADSPLSHFNVNICAANENIEMIERAIRTIKERIRCTWSPLPYTKAPKVMVDECIYDMVSVLNDFPHKNGISRNISPAAIVLGRPKLNCSNRTLSFGAYCEVYMGTTNDGTPRSVSSIALRPSNERGGYYFMSLDTGRRLHVMENS